MTGKLTVEDLRIRPETLEHQAAVAERHANPQLAENLRRAAELTRLPDEEVLAIYDALRPGRSTAARLTELAASLGERGLPRCAALIAEAAEVYTPPETGCALTSVIAGVDVGNATTEVVLVRDRAILGAARAPTRGRKGSPESVRGAAALVRRVEREAGRRADEARIAPLRPVDTSVLTVPDIAPSHGRLRVLAAGVPTPGGAGTCVASPGSSQVILVPANLRYDEAAARINAGQAPGAVLVAGDEGVLIANRLTAPVPVIDQVDVTAAAGCDLIAVEVRPPGQPLRLLSDPVALAAAFGLDDEDAAHAAVLCRMLTDYSNAVVGLLRSPDQAAADGDEPWVSTAEGRIPLRTACARIPDWAPGTVRALNGTRVDDLFAVDLAAAAEAVIVRRGSVGRAVLVASLTAAGNADSPADRLAGLLDVPVSSPLTEPEAARLGALTTPGARDGALVVDLGAGTIDVVGTEARVTVAGAGELLTAAVAELLGISRAAADWVKRGPCVRVDGGLRYEAEDGSRGFLGKPAPPSAAGMLAVSGPGGWLPFDRRRNPGEWRVIRLRIKQAVLSKNLERGMRAAGADPSQVLVTGGPAGDDELLAVIARSMPDGPAIGRGNVGGTLGHRHAAALGLALFDGQLLR